MEYLDFPAPFSVKTQDMPSLFAGKCHALLCRDYTKGRDWYDFVWYVSRKTTINFDFLQHAIAQAGPWVGKNISVTAPWLISELTQKISHIDWATARQDVGRFLKAQEALSLDVWSKEFFLSRLKKLAEYL